MANSSNKSQWCDGIWLKINTPHDVNTGEGKSSLLDVGAEIWGTLECTQRWNPHKPLYKKTMFGPKYDLTQRQQLLSNI